jgi:hypothetical protein
MAVLMRQSAADVRASWFQSGRFRVIALVFLGALLIVSAAQGILQRDNDFRVHYEQGAATLQGRNFLNLAHYPPGRHLFNAAIAIPPYRLSRALVYILAIASLMVLLTRWNRLADNRLPVSASRRSAALIVTLLVTWSYLFRDLDDCGLQIVLLFLLTEGGWAVVHGRSWQAGAWLAAAASYKPSALLFFPFLLYKRRWREAAHMLVFLAIFNVLVPAAILGKDETRRGWDVFLTVSTRTIAIDDPSLNLIEPPKHQNQSLKLSLARLVQHYPPAHPLAVPIADDVPAHDAIKDDYYAWMIDRRALSEAAGPEPQAPSPPRRSPFFLQLLSLSPAHANVMVSVVLLVLGGAIAWRVRRPWVDPATDENLPVEWAAATALCALLAPFAWMHHLILMVPAVLLVVRAHLAGPQPVWRRLVLGYATFTMVFLVYDLLTRYGWLLVIANGLHTWASMAVLLLVLTLPSRSLPHELSSPVDDLNSRDGAQAPT